MLLHRPNNHAIRSFVLITLLLAGCSANENGIDFGNKNDKTQGEAAAAANATPSSIIDTQTTCGLPAGSMNTPGTQIFTSSYKSLPIIVTGSSLMVGYRVTTQATMNLVGLNDGTNQSINVQVMNVETSSNFLGIPQSVAKKKAGEAAKMKSGSVSTTRISNGNWINLVSSGNPEYTGLFCAVSGTKSLSNNTGDGHGQVEFTPVLVNSISPLAPRETLDKELSAPRVFQVTAKVTTALENWEAGSHAGTITITPIPATAQFGGQTIAADVAYEIKADFPVGSNKLGLSRNQKFFINTKSHTIEAIIDDSGAIDPRSEAELPPTILIRQQ